uniref:Subtilisin-like protease n=1 Tax=Triticum urartu TaxID=4572 RepID=A0A8R7QUQ8_TRIUA
MPADMSLPAPRVLYSYSHAATGFAARLTGRQAAHLAAQRSVLAVVPDVMQQLHTTLTPSFLGLSASSGLLPASNGASDVVIGVLDTGVYPIDRAAFAADPLLPPPPGKFRGACVSAPSFNASAYCNGKLVGAKVFYVGYEVQLGGPINETEESKSPLDTLGHGTHTASTAAGSAVPDAAFYGYGRGNAVGMAPGARVASYKVCWKYGCATSDILAAFDEAIADGVDVISASFVSSGYAEPFYVDSTAVGAFSAVRKGIIVSAAAGNSGPAESTANNIAPWFLMTVGASTINRHFQADVVLGNGDTFSGASLYAGPPLGATETPLVHGRTVGSKTCEAGKLNASLIAGKIVLCDPAVLNVAQGEAVKLAGGVGAILTSMKEFGELVVGSPHTFPATTVTLAATKRIKKYITNIASRRRRSCSTAGSSAGWLLLLEWHHSRAAGQTSMRRRSSSRTSRHPAWRSSPLGPAPPRPRASGDKRRGHYNVLLGVPTRKWHRRNAPTGEAGVEPCRDQVRPDDHGVQRGQRRPRHRRHGHRQGVHAVRAWGRPHGPQPRP